MTLDASDPTRHWDGQQWLAWNGAAWAPEGHVLGQVAPVAAGYAPPAPGYPAAPQFAPPSAQQPYYAQPPFGQPAFASSGGPMTDQTDKSAEAVVAWILTVLTFGYMLPWAIAATRGKSNSAAIGVLTFFLGWSIIGWVIPLVMACGTHQVRHGGTQVNVIQHNGYQPPPRY